MDIERMNYKRLCVIVDHAFEELKQDPFSAERNFAYQQAKDQLDDVLADLVDAVEKRYRGD